MFVFQYEPELFPGLIYRMKQPKIVLLIFVSGKIVLTGAKVRFLSSSGGLLSLGIWLNMFCVVGSSLTLDL